MCDYCATNSGIYDCTQRCCRARLTVSHISMRRKPFQKREANKWFDYWKRMFAEGEATATIELARQLWAQRTSRLNRLL